MQQLHIYSSKTAWLEEAAAGIQRMWSAQTSTEQHQHHISSNQRIHLCVNLIQSLQLSSSLPPPGFMITLKLRDKRMLSADSTNRYFLRKCMYMFPQNRTGIWHIQGSRRFLPETWNVIEAWEDKLDSSCCGCKPLPTSHDTDYIHVCHKSILYVLRTLMELMTGIKCSWFRT